MTENRYFIRKCGDESYIIDSHVILEEEFDEKYEIDGYEAFELSLTPEGIINLLNQNNGLHDELAKKDIYLDFLEDENKHMKDVLEENKRLKKEISTTEDNQMHDAALIQQLRNALYTDPYKEFLKYRDKFAEVCEELTEVNKDYAELSRENEQLKNEIEMLKFTISRNESFINKIINNGVWR